MQLCYVILAFELNFILLSLPWTPALCVSTSAAPHNLSPRLRCCDLELCRVELRSILKPAFLCKNILNCKELFAGNEIQPDIPTDILTEIILLKRHSS